MKPVKLLEYWLPPDGAGDAVACLATTFTFDVDFFERDCLARFLRLSSVHGEGDVDSDVALMLEEEERLGEARVVVLADRNCRPEPRNLRWDLLPALVPGALLHAKATVLVWQKAMRIIIGSANLTSAGYRSQIEAAVAFDLDDEALVPDPFVRSVLAELRDIVDVHTRGQADQPGPKRRAFEILDTALERVGQVALPSVARRGLQIALAPGRTGVSPLEVRRQVWRGGPPRRVVALSPFWDGHAYMAGARAVLAELSQRSPAGSRTAATFVVAIDARLGGCVVCAPRALLAIVPRRVAAEVRSMPIETGDQRRLHAKALLYEGDDCVALMIGSSNLTAKGLGLESRSHREINVWFGAAAGTAEAEQLRAFLTLGDLVDDDWSWDVGGDEDEENVEPLPEGFVDALLTGGAAPTLQITLDPRTLPESWSVRIPAGDPVLDSEGWREAGRPRLHSSPVPADALPSALEVTWRLSGGDAHGTWPVNVGDLKMLPPSAELRDLPVSVLLKVLASTRPLYVALASERRHHRNAAQHLEPELDALKRFDSSGLLLQRVRRASAALWGMQRRLARPFVSLEALDWRLRGTVGPVRLAQGLVADAATGGLTATEAAFLLGELALTVGSVDWAPVGSALAPAEVNDRVHAALVDIAGLAGSLDMGSCTAVEGLAAYVQDAFKKAGAI